MSQVQDQTQPVITARVVDAKKILRYKYSPHMVEQLERFGRKYQHASSKEINHDEVVTETERLVALGCDNTNMEEKMFRSARYYFRKKGTEKKEPSKRKKYVSVPRLALTEMDNHIVTCITNDWYTPASGYEDFATRYEEVVTACKLHLESTGMEPAAIQAKIKKTYKNRYFVVCNKSKSVATETDATDSITEDLLALSLNS